MERRASPIVTHVEWGRIEVAGQTLKDAKLFPGGARAWDWNETGTRHRPGIQIADAQELIDRGATTILLSRGMELVLQVPAATVAWLEERGIRVEVLESKLAVARYNELCATEAVAALIHSTC